MLDPTDLSRGATMADLYEDPTLYGIEDVTVPSDELGGSSFPMRIYYPSDQGGVHSVAIRPGTYPLVAFAHGDRAGGGTDGDSLLTGPEPGCPSDVTQDYQRWSAVLHLLARCGIVVVSPRLDDIISSSEGSAARLEEAIRWVRFEWANRTVLWGREKFLDPDVAEVRSMSLQGSPDRPGLRELGVRDIGEGVGIRIPPIGPGGVVFGTPTNLGVAGHSWGARAAARVAGRGVVSVRAIASISGSWDENEAISAFIGARRPTLMTAGTGEPGNLSYLPSLYPQLVRPKHQAAFQGAGHWDYFGEDGAIQFCDPRNAGRCVSRVWSTASEILTGFFTKYLRNQWWNVPPTLLGDRFHFQPWGGGFPDSWFDWTEFTCGPRVRWEDPLARAPWATVGEDRFGFWSGQEPW
jgi:hypothetical protein